MRALAKYCKPLATMLPASTFGTINTSAIPAIGEAHSGGRRAAPFPSMSSEERILPSYNVHDLMLMYRWNPGFIKEVAFSLMLNNLLNEQYSTNAWIYRYFYGGAEYSMDGFFTQAGFNFMAGLTLRF